jgi:protein associated with RNAse G/E
MERKIRYDSSIAEYECMTLNVQEQSAVLFYIIEQSFTIQTDRIGLTIPEGSYTLGYYWTNRPYNLYFWRDREGKYLGSYFNIVRNTKISNEAVSYEDLIIDLLVLPNGEYFVLDEHELPEPMEQFENGFVKHALDSLTESLNIVLSDTIAISDGFYKHERFIPLLNGKTSR